MSFINRLRFGQPKPARELSPVVLDFKARTVARLGGKDTRTTIVDRLGPPTSFKDGQLRYDQLGLAFQLDGEERVTGLSIFFDGVRSHYRFEPPATELALREALGLPTKREVDEDEIMLEWRYEERFLGVDFSLDGVINDVFIDY